MIRYFLLQFPCTKPLSCDIYHSENERDPYGSVDPDGECRRDVGREAVCQPILFHLLLVHAGKRESEWIRGGEIGRRERRRITRRRRRRRRRRLFEYSY